MRPLPLILLLAASLPLGCASNSDAPPTDPRASVPSTSSDFDRTKDPALTADTFYAAGQLSEAQNSQAAITQYKKALKLDPVHRPSLYRLGVLYAQLRQHEESLKIWDDYLKATHGSPDAHANRGFCLELAGRPNDAEAAYKAGLAIDRNHAPCTVNLGLLLARTGREGEALFILQRLLSPAEAHYNLASVYESQGKKHQAKLEYQKALELDPKFADAQSRLAALPPEP